MFTLLIYIGYIAVWSLLVFLVSFISWRLSKSKKITIIAGFIAFGVMYWPAFGDLIPTLLAHKQLCKKEAGFIVYVTPEQWAEENPGILETLVPYKKYIAKENIELGNKRIGMSISINSLIDGSIQRKEVIVFDIKTKTVFFKDIDFSRGYGGLNHSLKFWLHSYSCYTESQQKEKMLVRKSFLRKLNTIWGN